MPLYPFVCDECHTEFEQLVVRSVTNVIAECPSCGSEKTTKRFGVPAKIPVSSGVSEGNGMCGVGPPCGAVGCRRISPT